jgi:hypothetical protein
VKYTHTVSVERTDEYGKRKTRVMPARMTKVFVCVPSWYGQGREIRFRQAEHSSDSLIVPESGNTLYRGYGAAIYYADLSTLKPL